MKAILALVGALVLSIPASAQQPTSGYDDPRIQTVEFRADQIVRIEAAIGFQVTVELAPDEQIQTVAVGDAGAWAVAVNKAGDRLFVKPTQAGVPTNMVAVTSARTYNFELSSSGGLTAYTIRFKYSAEAPVQPTLVGDVAGKYHLSGDRRLWPSGIHDDGGRTFIDWPPEAPLPAVYVVDSLGRELLANGNVRDGVYVIDGVERRLIFRIDHYVAQAARYLPKKRKS